MGLFNMSRQNDIIRENNSYKVDDYSIINDRNIMKNMRIEVINYINAQNLGNTILTGNENKVVLKEKLRELVTQWIEKTSSGGEVIARALYEELTRYLWGYYILDELVNDKDVSDIRVLSWNYIRYKNKGVRKKARLTFIDKDDYEQFISMLSVRNKKSLNDLNAITYFTDQTSNPLFILRINICTNYVCNHESPILIIRKIPKEKYTIEELIKRKMLTREVADYLIDKAVNSQGIIFTGKGASGKTTLLNTLLEHIDEGQSGVVIQENDELFISEKTDENGNTYPSRDIAFLHTVNMQGEGKIEYSLEELTRNGLRMDIDYFIIGEIKGNEAGGFSMASYTGHKCWATVHGMNSYEGINKLADYIKQATGYSFTDCLKKLIGIDIVVYMSNFKVCEITEIRGYDEKKQDLVKKTIYEEGRFIDD